MASTDELNWLLLHRKVEELYARYAAALDDGALEDWPTFFTDDCLYKIVPRENFERGLPLATMMCESRGMLQDRVDAIRKSLMFAPRTLRHSVANIRIVGEEESGALRVVANYVVFQTLPEDETRVLNVGRYLDLLMRESGQLKFKEKICVFDSVLVPNSIIYPL